MIYETIGKICTTIAIMFTALIVLFMSCYLGDYIKYKIPDWLIIIMAVLVMIGGAAVWFTIIYMAL
jgi:hypothetical protein